MDLLLSLKELKESLSTRRKDLNYSKKLDEFESLLGTLKSTDDKEYCGRLYKKKNLTKTYQSLKYRMEERLMNDILSLSAEEENLRSRKSANIVIGKLFYIATTLQKKNYRNQAIPLFEKCFRLAEKFHYFNYALISGEALSNHYGFVAVDLKKMEHYLKKNREFISILEAENFIRESNTIISNIYVSNKGYLSEKNIEIIKCRVEKMQELKNRYKTFIIISFTNDLSFFYYQSIKNYHESLKVALSSLEEVKVQNDKFSLFQTYQNIGTAYLLLNNYENSIHWLLKAKDLPSESSIYWFFTTSLLYLNYINIYDFKNLYQISTDVLSNKHLTKYPYFHEQWVIREAFLHFLISAGKIELSEEDQNSLKPFSVSRFLNSVPFHTKDKSGQNITIIIIQILFLLIEKKHDKIIDKIDTLTQYTYRYIKNDDTFRSNCFIKMLLKMASASFHPVRTKAHTAELYKKLVKSSLVTDEKSSQVEIIPYDYLWEIVLELLEKNK
jgi:tetratricopeptide (TPR) repeat protein